MIFRVRLNADGPDSTRVTQAKAHSETNRRVLLLGSAATFVSLAASAAPPAPAAPDLSGSARLLNGVLSGYGLPTVAISGQQQYQSPDLDYAFSYPNGWVMRRNSQRPGVVASDFQTADKVVVEVVSDRDADLRLFLDARRDAKPNNAVNGADGADGANGADAFGLGGGDDDAAVVATAVAACVAPGDSTGDSRLELPSAKRVRRWRDADSGLSMLAFPSETTTRSGYQVKRKTVAGFARDERRGRLYVVCASSRSELWSEEKERTLMRIVQSFRLS